MAYNTMDKWRYGTPNANVIPVVGGGGNLPYQRPRADAPAQNIQTGPFGRRFVPQNQAVPYGDGNQTQAALRTPQPTGGQSSVTTSITPGTIYSPQATQHAVNQARATAAMNANPLFAQKQFDRPGLSRSVGTMAAAMPTIADALSSGRAAATALPFADAAANAAHLLAGQTARDQEGLGLASINQMLSATQQNFDQSQRQNQMALLMQLLQGLGGLGGF